MSVKPQTTPKRLVVFISGSGTNLQAIIDAIASNALAATIVLVVSNRADAFGNQRAKQADIPVLYIPLKKYREAGKTREEYDHDLAERVVAYHPDLLVLAGWMHIFTPAFIETCQVPALNLHPALPGQFPGTHSIQRAFEAFQRGEITHSGCMVHYLVPEVDAGPVIAYEEVQINASDSLEQFEARMHDAEHKLIVSAVRIALTESSLHFTGQS